MKIELPLGTSSAPGHHRRIMNLGGTSGLVFRAKAYVDQLKERGLKTNCLNSETDTTNMERAEDVIAVHIKHTSNPDQLCPTAF